MDENDLLCYLRWKRDAEIEKLWGDLMKFLVCHSCHDAFQLREYSQTCTCGEVMGYYKKDGRSVKVGLRNADTAILFGVCNSILAGETLQKDAFVIPWANEWVDMFVVKKRWVMGGKNFELVVPEKETKKPKKKKESS